MMLTKPGEIFSGADLICFVILKQINLYILYLYTKLSGTENITEIPLYIKNAFIRALIQDNQLFTTGENQNPRSKISINLGQTSNRI